MERPIGAVSLSSDAKLSTLDCIAQSLAVGPIFSAAALGGALYGLSGGVGPFVILLTTVGILGLGVLVSELAKRFSGSGTVYEYVANTLGKRAAVFGAGCYHLAASALVAGIPLIGGIFAKSFLATHMSIDVAWWVPALAFAAVIVALNVLGVQISVRAQLAIIAASLIPFAILIVAVIADGGPNGNSLDSFNPSNAAEGGSVFKGLLFAILMFVGFELAAALGEETENPKRSIPTAVLSTIGIVSAFYVLTQYIGTIGSGGPDNLPFDFGALATHYVGSTLGVLIELAVLLDILAVGIGFCAATSRGIFTIARDGLLPAPLAQVNARSTPANAVLLEGVIMVGVILASLAKYGTGEAFSPEGAPQNVFNAFLIASTTGAFVICIVYVLVCVGGIKYFLAEGKIVPVVAGLIGLAVAGAGVAAQFVEGTAPVGDALWGRHIGLAIVALVAVWLGVSIASRPERVDLVGQHAVQHVEH